MYISAIVIIFALLTMSTVTASVFATGIRGDSAEGATVEEHLCWVNGYDSGFAGKYDSDRAKECIEYDDQYNFTWAIGCEDSTHTEEECGELINNPVEIVDYEALVFENNRTCDNAGFEDGKASTYNKERYEGCYEFGDYENKFQLGCQTHTTEISCQLLYEDKRNYCPNHPDIVGCVDFLHNATNKNPVSSICPGMADPGPSVSCFQETNPEKYCLQFDNPYCKTIGDLCDDEGFVRPEYPYCTTN